METYLFLDEVLHYNCGRGHEGRITKASELTEVKHEILLLRVAVMAGLIYIYLSKLGNEVSRVHVTSWLLSQYLTSLVYLATCDLTCVYGHS